MSNEFTNDDFQSMISEMENEKNASTFKSPYWKPAAEGTYQLRIITPLKQFGEKLFYEKHKMHYLGQRGYYCLNQTLKDKNGNVHEPEQCPICAKSRALYNASTKGTEEWDLAGKLRAKDRYVCRVIVRGKTTADGQDDETKPEFWEFGTKIHGYFFDQIKLGEAGNFLSLKDEGRDYNLVKKGSGRNTDYSGSCLSMKQTPIFTDVEKLKKLLEYLPKMEYSQLVEFVSADELKNALNDMLNGPAAAVEEENNNISTTETVSVNPTTPAAEEKVEDIDALLNMI